METSPLSFNIAWVLVLSARSLLISWLPYFSCSTYAWNNAEGGCGPVLERAVPRVIRPKKEYLKSHETCFANTLNLNDKGPRMKWVCSPKFSGSLAIWPWLRISSQSSLNGFYYLIISPDNDWWDLQILPMQISSFPCKLNPIKAGPGKGQAQALSFTERVAVSSIFLHRISVVRVNLSHLFHNAADIVGWCPHHPLLPFNLRERRICSPVQKILSLFSLSFLLICWPPPTLIVGTQMYIKYTHCQQRSVMLLY